MKFRNFSILTSLVIFASSLSADTLIMRDGNVLQGEIKSEAGGETIMVLRRLQIAGKNIKPSRRRSFDKIKRVYLKDGTIFTGIVKKMENGDQLMFSASEEKPIKAEWKVKDTAIEQKIKTQNLRVVYRGKSEVYENVMEMNWKKVVVEDINEAEGRRVVKMKEIKEVKDDTGKVYVDNKSDFMRNHRPQATLAVTPILPMGQLGSVLGMGFGVELSGSMYAWRDKINNMMPKFYRKYGMQFRVGGSLGFATFSSSSSDFDASVSMIPILAFAELSYPMKKVGIIPTGLRPYVQLAIGLSMVSVSRTFSETVTNGDTSGNVSESASSMDPSFRFTGGVGYTHRKLSATEFFGNLSYMMAFESVTGSFLYLSFGAAYKI